MAGHARWAAILAGGDGSRVRPLTQRLAGDDRPKQFCRILSASTLLGETVARVAYTVEPASTVFVVSREHETFYRRDLADVRASHVVAQPADRGTTAAVASAIMRIDHLACPDPIVGFFPSDHTYADERALRCALAQAYSTAIAHPDHIVLVGARATAPETDLCWIELGESIQRGGGRGVFYRLPVTRVQRFVDRPSPVSAARLLEGGCCWNTLIAVGHIRAFMDILRDVLPETWEKFESAGGTRLARDAGLVRSLYDSLEGSDFHRDVLGERPDRLAVVGPLDAGWTDLGQPKRVLAAMAMRQMPRPGLRQVAS